MLDGVGHKDEKSKILKDLKKKKLYTYKTVFKSNSMPVDLLKHLFESLCK